MRSSSILLALCALSALLCLSAPAAAASAAAAASTTLVMCPANDLMCLSSSCKEVSVVLDACISPAPYGLVTMNNVSSMLVHLWPETNELQVKTWYGLDCHTAEATYSFQGDECNERDGGNYSWTIRSPIIAPCTLSAFNLGGARFAPCAAQERVTSYGVQPNACFTSNLPDQIYPSVYYNVSLATKEWGMQLYEKPGCASANGAPPGAQMNATLGDCAYEHQYELVCNGEKMTMLREEAADEQ